MKPRIYTALTASVPPTTGLAIEFDSPAANLIGFEHAVSSDQDERAVTKVAQQLCKPLSLLILPSAARPSRLYRHRPHYLARCARRPIRLPD